MDDIFLFNFSSIETSDLNEGNQEKIRHFFQRWEKRVRHSSAIHSLNQELKIDSSKVFDVTVATKKESPTTTG
jgi:hypothetical protein